MPSKKPATPSKKRAMPSKKRAMRARTVEHPLKKASTQKRAGVISTGAGVAVAVASPFALKSSSVDMQRYFSHLLVKDRPINEIPIVIAHNTNTYMGSGTLPIASNQTMGITELLNTTPVRGFELDVWEHQGECVINHGGKFDPLVSKPATLDSALTEINAWLDKPENKNEVVFVCFERHVKPVQLDSHINNAFGESHVTEINGHIENINGEKMVCLNEDTMNSSIEKLVSQGHRVVQIPLARDYIVNEGRTSLGALLRGIHPEVVNPINTEEMDTLVNSGKGTFIKLDQITPNDPRFFTPRDREILGLKPSVSLLHDSVYLGKGNLSAAFWGGGAGLASGGIIFAFSSGLLQAYNNYRFFKRFPTEAENILKEI